MVQLKIMIDNDKLSRLIFFISNGRNKHIVHNEDH